MKDWIVCVNNIELTHGYIKGNGTVSGSGAYLCDWSVITPAYKIDDGLIDDIQLSYYTKIDKETESHILDTIEKIIQNHMNVLK